MFIPSKYQNDFFDFLVNGSGSGRIDAVAGSGKTTTLAEGSKRISGTSLFCAFNKHIEQELSLVLPESISCRTIHSIGMGALYKHIGKLSVVEDKYKEICQPMGHSFAKAARMTLLANRDADAITTPGRASMILSKLAKMAMMTLTDPTDQKALLDMSNRYSIGVPKCQREEFFSIVPKIIDKGEAMTRDGVISFEDMIYYPAVHGLSGKEHLWVFVDEAQDLSASQLAVVRNSLKNRGRMMAVGDPLQSIYGFTGADPWSFDRLGGDGVTDLPLSICYRCAESIVDLASGIAPQIESREGAEEGSVYDIHVDELAEEVSGGDMVLCRTNAPLVSTVISLVQEGVRAYMRGQDIMSNMIDIVDTVTTRDSDWRTFSVTLNEMKASLVSKMQEDGDESTASIVGDIYDAVDACATRMGCHSHDQLRNKIKDMFRETPDSVVCSSIHKSKGLEADNVFVIKPNKIRLRWKDQLEWQKYQEQCCEYIAITRAKENLCFVMEDGDKPYSVGERIALPKQKTGEQHEK